MLCCVILRFLSFRLDLESWINEPPASSSSESDLDEGPSLLNHNNFATPMFQTTAQEEKQKKKAEPTKAELQKVAPPPK